MNGVYYVAPPGAIWVILIPFVVVFVLLWLSIRSDLDRVRRRPKTTTVIKRPKGKSNDDDSSPPSGFIGLW